MDVEIITRPLRLEVYGFSGTAINKNYTQTAFKLSGQTWEFIKSNNIKHKGLNIWIYESEDKVFAGVELDELPGQDIGLELKTIHLKKYAHFKHVGPYSMIGQIGLAMKSELKIKGIDTHLPYIEIYGHWDNDEAKLETDLFMSFE